MELEGTATLSCMLIMMSLLVLIVFFCFMYFICIVVNKLYFVLFRFLVNKLIEISSKFILHLTFLEAIYAVSVINFSSLYMISNLQKLEIQ